MSAKPDHPAHANADDCPYGYAHEVAVAILDPDFDAIVDRNIERVAHLLGIDIATERELQSG